MSDGFMIPPVNRRENWQFLTYESGNFNRLKDEANGILGLFVLPPSNVHHEEYGQIFIRNVENEITASMICLKSYDNMGFNVAVFRRSLKAVFNWLEQQQLKINTIYVNTLMIKKKDIVTMCYTLDECLMDYGIENLRVYIDLETLSIEKNEDE